MTIPEKNSLKIKMQVKERFSKRMGLQALTAEITTRYDAPEEFRQYLFFVMQKYGLGLKKIREVVCLASKQAPDSSQWGENDFMKSEIEEKMGFSFWPYIYDLIEMFYDKLNVSEKKDFSDSINEYFLIHDLDEYKLFREFLEYQKVHNVKRKDIADDIRQMTAEGAKCVRDRIKQHEDDFYRLYANIKHFVAMGFSFNDIDMLYIEKIIAVNRKIADTDWTVYWHEDGEEDSLRSKLKLLGIKEDNIVPKRW